MRDILFNVWMMTVGTVVCAAYLGSLFGFLHWAPESDLYVFVTANMLAMVPAAVLMVAGMRVADRIW